MTQYFRTQVNLNPDATRCDPAGDNFDESERVYWHSIVRVRHGLNLDKMSPTYYHHLLGWHHSMLGDKVFPYLNFSWDLKYWCSVQMSEVLPWIWARFCQLFFFFFPECNPIVNLIYHEWNEIGRAYQSKVGLTELVCTFKSSGLITCVIFSHAHMQTKQNISSRALNFTSEFQRFINCLKDMITQVQSNSQFYS